MLGKQIISIVVVVLFGPLFVIASVAQDEIPEKNLGRPFQQIDQKLDQVNTQIEVVPEIVYSALRSGSKRWVSPTWKDSDTTKNAPHEDYDKQDTVVYILNPSLVDHATVKVILHQTLYDGHKTCVLNLDIIPLQRQIVWGGNFFPCSEFSMGGWLEIAADMDIFVDGFFGIVGEHEKGVYYTTDNAPNFTTYSKRTMTWYPVNDE